jgi:hypothetical protein
MKNELVSRKQYYPVIRNSMRARNNPFSGDIHWI